MKVVSVTFWLFWRTRVHSITLWHAMQAILALNSSPARHVGRCRESEHTSVGSKISVYPRCARVLYIMRYKILLVEPGRKKSFWMHPYRFIRARAIGATSRHPGTFYHNRTTPFFTPFFSPSHEISGRIKSSNVVTRPPVIGDKTFVSPFFPFFFQYFFHFCFFFRRGSRWCMTCGVKWNHGSIHRVYCVLKKRGGFYKILFVQATISVFRSLMLQVYFEYYISFICVIWMIFPKCFFKDC